MKENSTIPEPRLFLDVATGKFVWEFRPRGIAGELCQKAILASVVRTMGKVENPSASRLIGSVKGKSANILEMGWIQEVKKLSDLTQEEQEEVDRAFEKIQAELHELYNTQELRAVFGDAGAASRPSVIGRGDTLNVEANDNAKVTVNQYFFHRKEKPCQE